jgi:hypothetical protein
MGPQKPVLIILYRILSCSLRNLCNVDALSWSVKPRERSKDVIPHSHELKLQEPQSHWAGPPVVRESPKAVSLGKEEARVSITWHSCCTPSRESLCCQS